MEVTGPLSRHSWGGMRDESQHHLRGRLRVNRIQNVTIFHLRFLGFPLNCKSPLQKLTVQITPKLINYNYYFKAMNFYCGSANYLPASESQCEPCESSLEPFLRIFLKKKSWMNFFFVSYLCYLEKMLSIQIAQDPQKIKTMRQNLLRFKTSERNIWMDTWMASIDTCHSLISMISI